MEDNEKDLRVAYPGQPVEGLAPGITITVYPAGFRHIRKFAKNIGALVARLAQVPMAIDEKTQQLSSETLTRYSQVVVNVLLDDLFELVKECCVSNVDIDELPHWECPKVVVAWLEENFLGVEKVRPWVQAIERISTSFLGVEVQLWDKVSQLWSPAVIDSVKSSMRSSLGSRMAAGRSTSGTPGTTTPSTPSGSAGRT